VLGDHVALGEAGVVRVLICFDDFDAVARVVST
jgi:hypothetical protein